MSRALDALDLDNIESAAKGNLRGIPVPFAHPADTLKLVAELARLCAALAERDAWAAVAVEALRMAEWGASVGMYDEPGCPVCDAKRGEHAPGPHRPDCPLHRALSTAPEVGL